MKFKNPIIPGFYPDPSVCCVEENYYLVTSSFEYYPGVPIFHSKDLINWEQIGYCLTNETQLPLKKARCSGGIYAPTIRYNDGLFYITTTNVSHGGNFYVTAKDPKGMWSDPIYVDIGGIDPSLFFDDDGKVYYTTNAGLDGKSGIVGAEIDITTGDFLSDIKLLWAGSGGRCLEAPHIYKINGMYYLLAAEGGTQYGHMVTLAKSNSVLGKYEGYLKNPVLSHRDYNNNIIQGTGHGDLVQDHKGNWWIVFLAFRNGVRLFHHLGRETFIAPVEWNEDGWFIVNKIGTVELEMEANCLPKYEFSKSPVREDFDKEKFDLCWNFLRNPYKECYSLTERKGWLTLKGNIFTLNDIDSPTFLCRRQQHFDCTIKTLLEFKPMRIGEEAGLAVFYDNEHHYEIAVTLIENEKYVIVRRRIGDLCAIVAQEKVEEKTITLQITADAEIYSFGYCKEGEKVKVLATGRAQYLSTEATRVSFTGVFFGTYCTGTGKECNSPAYFDWFDYEPISSESKR